MSLAPVPDKYATMADVCVSLAPVPDQRSLGQEEKHKGSLLTPAVLAGAHAASKLGPRDYDSPRDKAQAKAPAKIA